MTEYRLVNSSHGFPAPYFSRRRSLPSLLLIRPLHGSELCHVNVVVIIIIIAAAC